MSEPKIEYRVGQVLATLRTLPTASVHCVISSPPYFGLRSYDGDQVAVWGGDDSCDHAWEETGPPPTKNATQGSTNGTGGHPSGYGVKQKEGLVVHRGRSAAPIPGRLRSKEENLDDSGRGDRKEVLSKSSSCPKCGAYRGELGLEPSPDLYVAHLVDVFREVRRVLRPDGTLWINIGDTFFGDSPVRRRSEEAFSEEWDPDQTRSRGGDRRSAARIGDLKPSELVGVPGRLAAALRADGWWLRDEICWEKTNPMPEPNAGWRWERHRLWETYVDDDGKTRRRLRPVDDPCPGCDECAPNDGLILRKGSWRTTRSYEIILLLAPSESYYGDGESLREPLTSSPSDIRKMVEQKDRIGGKTLTTDDPMLKASVKTNIGRKRGVGDPFAGRACRSVWTIPTAPFSGAHFATFPPELPRRCILAGTPDAGVCATCGAPFARVLEKTYANPAIRDQASQEGHYTVGKSRPGEIGGMNHGDFPTGLTTITTGWRATCACPKANPVPAVVLDCFAGSGTTLVAAHQLGRSAIGIDCGPYKPLFERRLAEAIDGPPTELEKRAVKEKGRTASLDSFEPEVYVVPPTD